MNSQQSFYKYVSRLSDITSKKKYLEGIHQQLYHAITEKHRDIIEKAATGGAKQAILFSYHRNAKYLGKFTVHTYMSPSPELRDELRSLGITPIMDLVRKCVEPFELELVPNEDNPEIMMLTVKWR